MEDKDEACPTVAGNLGGCPDADGDGIRDQDGTLVAGHTDSMGSSESNQRLSQRRTDAVKKYLSDAGISTNRIIAVGYGENRPVADNENSAGRRQNRRVELSVDYLR